MSSHFQGEGNIGSDPQVVVFPVTNNSEPRALLRLNVFFDNPAPVGGGQFEDRGGFWAPVELVRAVEICERWSSLYQRGMRVLVTGRMVMDKWNDKNTGAERSGMKVHARSIGILPFRIASVVMAAGSGPSAQKAGAEPDIYDDYDRDGRVGLGF
ncbi:single-stranded DNA-binding protein [Azotobacter vinelandii]|uniref:single-stranded DNA-binding protein n=1 Tax=Azotobacter vinelandii TaxID=354 RepID=UPI0007738CF4|nr:single-stranded DNA-binding protein [Azotobacter vinelandii]